MDVEVWKDAIGFEGLYKVSNYGRVKSFDRIDALGRLRKGRIMSLGNVSGGYKGVTFYLNGRKYMKTVHSVVSKSFRGNPCDGYIIDHKNGNKKDNRLSNLEYVTHRENTCRYHESKGRTVGVYKRGSKYIAMKSFKNKTFYLGIFKNIKDAKEAYERAVSPEKNN